MIKEKVKYNSNLPVKATVLEIEEYPIHYHDDVELLMVLEGSLSIKVGYYKAVLHAGDVFVMNDIEIHSLSKTDERNKVMMIHLDLNYFARYYEELVNCFFIAEANEDSLASVQDLKNLMARIMIETIQHNRGYEERIIKQSYQLIDLMISDFQYFYVEKDRFVNVGASKTTKVLSERIHRIVNYMYDNYSSKLTLQDVADMEYLSSYYLSHTMKSATGLNFQDLLCFIRVEQSEKLLLDSEKKLTTISKDIGFSALNYYKKHFEKWFGMPPEEYRNINSSKVLSDTNPAKYKVVDEKTTEFVINHKLNGIDNDYDGFAVSDRIDISVDLNDYNSSDIKGSFFIDELIVNRLNEVMFKPYESVTFLTERIIASDHNYRISASFNDDNELFGVTVVIYNTDLNFENTIRNITQINSMIDNVKRFDKNSEFMIKIKGLEGNFVIRRSKIHNNGYIARLNSAGKIFRKNTREHLINIHNGMPVSSDIEVSLSGEINLCSMFNGFESEIILIDKL